MNTVSPNPDAAAGKGRRKIGRGINQVVAGAVVQIGVANESIARGDNLESTGAAQNVSGRSRSGSGIRKTYAGRTGIFLDLPGTCAAAVVVPLEAVEGTIASGAESDTE